jgi:hypothetical protein
MAQALPKQVIQKILMKVLSGKSNYRVSREMDVSEYTVYPHTSDPPASTEKNPLYGERNYNFLHNSSPKDISYPQRKTENISEQSNNYYL